MSHAFGHEFTDNTVRACRLKDQAFPIGVRFASGWKEVHYVTCSLFRDEDIVTLFDRDGKEIAKVYPYTELRIRR